MNIKPHAVLLAELAVGKAVLQLMLKDLVHLTELKQLILNSQLSKQDFTRRAIV
jgi:hypothetical protein